MLEQSIKNPKGISMVEIMLTLLIISTCLIVVLRGFSVCAVVVSRAHNSILAVDIIQEKMDELREKAILEDGVWVSSREEYITIEERDLWYSENISEWQDPNYIDKEDVSSEEKEVDPFLLCEVESEASWKSHGERSGIKAKTIIPAKGVMGKL